MKLIFKRCIKTICFAAFLSGGLLTPVFACDTTLILAEAELISLDQAVNRIKKNRKGKVLGAETLQIKGKPVHVIKVLTKSGHVKKIHIKPRPNKP